MLPIRGFASTAVDHTDAPADRAQRSNPTLVAELHEESIPGQDLASPAASASPAAAPAADNNTSPGNNADSGQWERVPNGSAPPAENTIPVSNPMPASAQAPPVNPADVAPAIDVGSIATTPNVSDQSLAPLIDTAPNPARAASLRITEHERIELERGHTDDAIRELGRAVSIDPSNSYAYFYLGRAYIARKSYPQALTFFKRAEIGVAANSAWL
ncbi:MAG TPA: tetratricopeptide repeat protein, partial [Patescibacteria group bacterium]|nr:tetratricopeptide repeat protein [Patescibacteria group bacterium]